MASAKQRYYANQAKKGNISKAQAASYGVSKKDKPKATSTKISSPSQSYNQSSGYVSYDSNGNGMSTNQAPTTGNQLFNIPTNALQNAISPSTAVAENSNSNYTNVGGKTVAKTSSSKSSSSKGNGNSNSGSSNRSVASSIQQGANNVMGIPTVSADTGGSVLGASTSRAAAKPNIVASNPTGLGSGLRWLNDTLGYGYGKLTGAEDPMLGLTTQLMGGDLGWSEAMGLNSFLRDNPATGGDYRSPNTTTAINVDDLGTSREQRAIDERTKAGVTPVVDNGRGYIYTPGAGNTEQTTVNNDKNKSRPAPQPTNNPWQAPTIFQQPSQTVNPYVATEAPNGTSIQAENGTQRQYLGNGYMSSGQFGNGGALGDRNPGMPQGSLSSTGVDQNGGLMNDLLSLFGNTAQASELPMSQNANAFGMPYTGYSSQGGGMSTRNGTDIAPSFASGLNGGGPSVNGADKPAITPPAHQNYQTQQTQPTAKQQKLMSQNDFIKQYMQGNNFDEQTNNANQQIANLIKSINDQYGQQQTEGQQSLDKQALQNSQQLNSQFSFANSDPNDEQRIQYQQRGQADAATALTSFLAKLAASKSQDTMGAQNKGLDLINSINQNKQSALQSARTGYQAYTKDAQDRQTAAANQAWDRNYKMQQLSKSGSTPKYQATFDNNGNVTGSYSIGKDGKINYQAVATPFQGKSISQNPFMQFLAGQQISQNKGGSWEVDPTTGEQVWVTD